MHFKFLQNLDQVSRLSEFLQKLETPYSLDLETTMTDPWRGKIVGAGFCWSRKGAIYVPFRHEYDQPFDGEKALCILLPIISKKAFVAFNAIFEIDFIELSENTVVNAPIIDVSLLSYVAGRYPGLSLKVVSRMECPQVGVQSYGEFMTSQELKGAKYNIGQARVSAVAEYCGRDALATFLLYEKLYGVFKNHPIYKLEEAVFPVTKQMRRNGVLIDKEYFENEKVRLVQYLELLQKLIESQVSERAGKPISFNIGSNIQLGEVLFDILQLPCVEYTDKGARRTGKEILFGFKWKEPIVRNLIAWKEISKRKSTYYDTYVKFAQKDGRIHSSYNQSGVPSGRFSSSDPNLQNLPVKETWEIFSTEGAFPELRAEPRMGYIVPEDCWLLEFDYSQIEARIAAGVTQEPVLLDAFEKGIDFHTKTASLMFRVPTDGVTKKQRRLAKTLNFVLIYGAGVGQLFNSLLEEMDINYEQTQHLYDKYHRIYREMFYGADIIAKEAQSKGYITTKFGRRVPIFLFAEAMSAGSLKNKKLAEAQRMAYNQLVQGGAADVVKLGMVKSHRMIASKYSLQTVKLIMMTHDSLAFEVKNSVNYVSLIDDTRESLRYKMEGFPECFVNVSMGKRLGALTEKEDNETTAAFVARVQGGNSTVVENPSKEVEMSKELATPKEGMSLVLELPEGGAARTLRQVESLRDLFKRNPGHNTVTLRIGIVETVLPYKTGISMADKNKLLLLVGGKLYEKK